MPTLVPGEMARCSRCGNVLARRRSAAIDRSLSLTLTALIVFAVAHSSPLMSLSVVGRESSATIIEGVYRMWMLGRPVTAALVAFCTAVAPALYLLFMLALLLVARRPALPHAFGELLRWAQHLHPWVMFEVMLLGLLVAMIKIADVATVEPGVGLGALLLLALLLPAIATSFDADRIWARVPLADSDDAVAVGDPDMPEVRLS